MQWPKVINAPLSEVDPELYDIIEKEKNRQYKVSGQHKAVFNQRQPFLHTPVAAIHVTLDV